MTLQDLLMIFTTAAWIGFLLYTVEIFRDRIKRHTRWGDLTLYQSFVAGFTIGGTVLMLATLVVGAMLKA